MTYRVVHSDCVEALRAMPEASIDAVVTDPPYELGFMGKRWDASGIAYSLDLWREVLRVLKPGGHLCAFGGTRTYHRMACAIEDAGFEVRDSLHWMYGSGFPKSLNVATVIDAIDFNPEMPPPDPLPWDGFGTALKPTHEPIVLARKPLAGTVAANVLAHGTGGLNVDGCRLAYAGPADLASAAFGNGSARRGGIMGENVPGRGPQEGNPAGRWPPNLLLSHHPKCHPHVCAPGCPVALLDEQSGDTQSSDRERANTPAGGGDIFRSTQPWTTGGFADSGGASRFFPVFQYVAKPSRAERDAGLDDLPERSGGEATDREDGSDGLRSPRAGAGRNGGARNHHPTVKPVALMEWLVRLVTPPGGTVLDPFLGSGTTGCAAVRLGFDFIGIEREAEYVEIAERRIRLALNAPRTKPLGGLERGPEALPGQVSLFGSATRGEGT